jgi:two-component system response regulator YesN
MYKAFIVDDEALIREALKIFVDWEQLGFTLVGEASNGLDAFDGILESDPHVLVTDIRMPACSGIELIERIGREKIDIKIIILSVYDDFEYVRNALKAGAVDYQLKPIDYVSLGESLKKTKARLDMEACNEKIKNDMLIIRKEKFVLALAEDEFSDEACLLGKLNEYGIAIKGKFYYSMVIELDHYSALSIEISKVHLKEIRNRIKKELQDLAGLYNGECWANDGENRVNAILGVDIQDSRFINEKLKERLDKTIGLSVTIYSGEVVDAVHKLGKSFHSLQKLYPLKFFLGTNKTIQLEDMDQVPSGKTKKGRDQFANALLNKLENQDVEGIDDFVKEYFRVFAGKEEAIVEYLDVMGLLEKFCKKKELKWDDVQNRDLHNPNIISQLETMDDVIQQILYNIHAITDYMGKTENVNGSCVSDKIMDYINLNLDKNITLEMVAGIVYMHPFYLSRLFKKQTGMSFTDYLMKARIEKARQLMQDASLKTYEIAESVGYQSQRHFRKLFKDIVGVSPREYRKSVINYYED